MKKAIMKLACSFNEWLYRKYGVIDARKYMGGKEVHLNAEAFFEMFDEYDCIENYSGTYDKLYVREGDTLFFTLTEREG